ncbi:Cilia- and flagella-associated 61, partial [Paramuricea clavata]
MDERQEVVLTARRTESVDAPAIEKLISSVTFELFGRVDIVRVIEKANLAVTLVSSDEEVVASGAFFDYPNLAVDQAKWEKLFQETFQSIKPTPLNSLFLNFFASKPDYVQGCASEILRTVFNTASYIEYIFLVMPTNAQEGLPLQKLFNAVKCNDNIDKENLNGTVHVCYRFEHMPKLHMRPATVEDHDDLTPIFDEQSDSLINSYGDFFLNDLIEAEDDENKCLVADVNGAAVGFLSISTNVNVELLSEYFDLSPFNDLRKQSSSNTSDRASVFCVELFCIDEKYEARSMDFLPAAFKLFADKDYCVITMPHIVNEFPLVQEFTRVTPKADATTSHELYVFHRWGLIRTISIRPAISEDFNGIQNIVANISGSDVLLRDVEQYSKARRDQDGQELQVFVAECTNQVIGVAVLRQEEDIEFIRAHYAVEDFIYYNYHQREEHAHLFHFTVNPIFRHYTRHFLKEVLRLSHKSCLYYSLYPKGVDPNMSATKKYSVISCLSDLVPVRARRQVIYQEDILGINAPSKKVLKKEEYYALYHLNRKLTLEPKLIINARIVVVGASDTGISFLERFCFCPHLHFRNISIISPQGLPNDIGNNGNDIEMRPSSCCYTKENYAHLSLKTWINVVEDKMVAVDRADKIISTLTGHQVPYDYLVLCCGEQFQIAVPSGADVNTLVTTAEVPRSRDQVHKGKLPSNVFTINSHQDVQDTLHWIETSFAYSEGKAVIYGAALASYTFIQGMVACGVPGSRLVMVQPPTNLPSSFNNPEVDDLVENSLENADVTLYKDYTLARWNHREESDLLKNASFTSSNKPLMLECQAFFCFQDKKVDYQAYKAINDSCLVYDGKLVVDKEFLTNDPAIRAAGPLTKFARRYHSESWTHANFNSKEVGKLLAESMLPLFDPTVQPSANGKDASLVPVFKEPKINSGLLPGGFNYLYVGKPTLNIRLDSLMAQPDYGYVLTTGAPGDEERGYFRLHINQYNNIETLTCLCKQDIDVSNLICLYGIHERYLNNLCQRYSEGLITDFYSYFKESWCVALFHDRFKDLRAEIREILSNVKGHDLESMKDKVKKLIDEDLELSPADRDSLHSSYMKSPARTEIEKTLLNFLTYNSAHLPMTDILSEWYEQSATMMGEEGAVIGGLLVGLNVIDCTICIKGGDLDVQRSIIDLSFYLKEGNYLEKPDDERPSSPNNESQNVNMELVLDQKAYLEEINRSLSSTVTDLQAKVKYLEELDKGQKEELGNVKLELKTLLEERDDLRKGSDVVVLQHKRQLEIVQADISVERETYVKSREGLNEMYDDVRKQLELEKKLRK